MSNKSLEKTSNQQLSEDDISFIKKNNRYPLDSIKRIFPFIFYLFSTSLIIYFCVLLSHFNLMVISKTIVQSIPLLFVLASMTLGLYRYWKSLFFEKLVSINNEYENTYILEDFFKENNFRTIQVAEHAEVFLMTGKEDISTEETEIVVFIATGNLILVNSHISTHNIFPKSRRKFMELIDLLKQFLIKKSPLSFSLANFSNQNTSSN